MSQYISILGEADAAALAVEQAKNKVELAKLSLENAKQELEQAKSRFDDVLARADDSGLARAKLKKLVEERISGMATLGLIPTAPVAAQPALVDKPKTKRAASKAKIADADRATDAESATLEATTIQAATTDAGQDEPARTGQIEGAAASTAVNAAANAATEASESDEDAWMADQPPASQTAATI